MGRLLAIDYGRKRCGIAVTDTLRIVASALETVPTVRLCALMLDSGLGRMKRRDKATVDRTAACIILNDFLQSRRYTELTAAARSNQSSE